MPSITRQSYLIVSGWPWEAAIVPVAALAGTAALLAVLIGPVVALRSWGASAARSTVVHAIYLGLGEPELDVAKRVLRLRAIVGTEARQTDDVDSLAMRAEVWLADESADGTRPDFAH